MSFWKIHQAKSPDSSGLWTGGRRLRQRESETSPCALNFHEAVKNRLTPFECTSFWPWQYFIGHVPVKTEGQVCWGHSISSWWRDARAPLGKQPCNIPAKQKVLLGTSFSSYWKTTSSSLCKLMGKELDYKPTEYCSQPLSPHFKAHRALGRVPAPWGGQVTITSTAVRGGESCCRLSTSPFLLI